MTNMDLKKLKEEDIINLYSDLVIELKEREIIRSKNVTGDLGERIAINYYTKTKGLPKLQFAPPSTKNIDAISVDGDRYSIKTTSGNITGVFYGIKKDSDIKDVKPAFEYLIIVVMDDNYKVKKIIEIDWKTFFKHKKWHSRMNAYNISVTKKLLEDSVIRYDSDAENVKEK